ncbi:MAG: NUDIX domain-containing protein [Bacteroidetes bacterium]|nr:MAG: NUDIX domain-containing protein [Bacteroidota bacterium]
MKVFINDLMLEILKEPKEEGQRAANYVKINSAEEILTIYEQIRNQEMPIDGDFQFEVKDYKKVVKKFKANFQIIKAAGGLVMKEDSVLFIKRLGKWDLPKGKIEVSEKKKIAAIREIEEETGVKTNIKRKIGTTWHTYQIQNQAILKQTIWYEMICEDDSQLKAQTEEDITEVRFLNKRSISKILKNTYHSIAFIYKKYLVKSQKTSKKIK